MLFEEIAESFDPRLKTKLVIIKLIMLNVLEKNSLEIGFCVLGITGLRYWRRPEERGIRNASASDRRR